MVANPAQRTEAYHCRLDLTAMPFGTSPPRVFFLRRSQVEGAVGLLKNRLNSFIQLPIEVETAHAGGGHAERTLAREHVHRSVCGYCRFELELFSFRS